MSCIARPSLQKHGKYYSVNVPLRDGTDDATFHRLFKPIMQVLLRVVLPHWDCLVKPEGMVLCAVARAS